MPMAASAWAEEVPRKVKAAAARTNVNLARVFIGVTSKSAECVDLPAARQSQGGSSAPSLDANKWRRSRVINIARRSARSTYSVRNAVIGLTFVARRAGR